MRIETTSRTLFTYDELSDQAKEKALDWYRKCTAGDYFWSECAIDNVKQAGALLGIDIDRVYFSGFWSQGDCACFTGRYRYRKGWKKALASEFGGRSLSELLPIGQALQSAQAPVFFTGSATITHSGNYSHSGCMRFNCDIERGNFEDFEDAIKEALRSFADLIYRQLESEYNYQNSDEQVTEAILANEYEFTEDGGIA